MNMKCAFINSIPSPHQIPLGEALHNILGENFKMVFSKRLDSSKSKVIWNEPKLDYPWVIVTYDTLDDSKILHEIIDSFDIIVYGAVSTDLVRDRIRNGKLTFRYMERPFKHGFFLGLLWWFNRLRKDFWPLNMSNHHLLAASAYCAKDFRKLRMFDTRQWKWGYFTPVTDCNLMSKQVKPLKILWAGRMVNWKRVDLILKAAFYLKQKGKKFEISIIGEGPEKKSLQYYVNKNRLEEYITFIPPVPIDLVREYMAASNIYIMPSNKQEGWGAVINEAMASGCCVVSSTGPGAAPWLIDHGKTGYLFQEGNIGELSSILTQLIDNPELCQMVGRNACEKMKLLWSPNVAAERFIRLAYGLMGLCDLPEYIDGPCSRA